MNSNNPTGMVGSNKVISTTKERLEKIFGEIHNQISSLDYKVDVLSISDCIQEVRVNVGDNYIERELYDILQRLSDLNAKII